MSVNAADSMKIDGFLRSLNVLELGDGLAGAGATAILSMLGANVTTVVDPRTTFRRAQPSLKSADGTETSLISLLLDNGKVRLDWLPTSEVDLNSLIKSGPANAESAGYDLVVVDRVAGAPYAISSLEGAAQYASWVESVNTRAWLSVSAFGLSGPRANDVASEITLSAASILLSAVSDPATGQPLKLGGNQALLSAAQAAALASCQAVDLASDGTSVHLDLSAQEASLSMGPMLAFAHQLLNCKSAMGAKRYGAPASFYHCTDGLIRISAMEDHQWQGVVRAMGSPTWTEKFTETESRIEFPEEIDEGIAKWSINLSKAEAEAKLQDEGVPATSMNKPAEIIASPQLAYRGALKTIVLGDGVKVQAVGRPFPDKSDTTTGTEFARRRSLRGLRVLEASHVLAVPLAGALLGALGAKVTKLEDVDRIDMYRRRGPYIDAESGINRAAYFTMVNHSKISLAVDLNGDTSALASLASEADVFIENVGTRRLERFGISDAYSGNRPEQLAVSSSGFGNEGPHAHFRAYAYNLQTSCGLGYLTRNKAGEPAEIDLAWADLLSGYALATIVAAWTVGPEGNEGRVIDFAMAELIDARFNEFLAAASLDPASDDTVDRANEVSPFAPNGVYRSKDGWIALSVDSDESFRGLGELLGFDAATLTRFDSRARRAVSLAELDALLANAFSSDSTDAWLMKLDSADVLAERVATVDDLVNDAHLAQRGYFTELEHPEWGRRRVLGIPWRPVGSGPIHLGHPPLLATSSRSEAS
jgi:crotonobetainyl-CoA:carnitine CoA-transferase CaiB-like acyl-CoA transferase